MKIANRTIDLRVPELVFEGDRVSLALEGWWCFNRTDAPTRRDRLPSVAPALAVLGSTERPSV